MPRSFLSPDLAIVYPAAFWWESNAVFGWVCTREDWREILDELARHNPHGRERVLEARQAAWDHGAVVMSAPASRSFGFAREHVEGPRTLREYALEHGLAWVVELAEAP